MKKINISQVDTFFANGSYPIEMLFFYSKKIASKRICVALKNLSSIFWPIFGQYRDGIIQFDRYCESNHFEEVAQNETFDQHIPAKEMYEKYRFSIHSGGESLFYLKIIQFKNGTVLIPKLNHLVGDGYSYFYFLSVLANLTQNTSIPFKKIILRYILKPHHKRTILKEFKFNDPGLEPDPVDENLTIKFEHISRMEIRNMIKDVVSNTNYHVSANDLLSAMLTKKMISYQKNYNQEYFRLTIPIDVRRQISKYGAKFFGNGLLFHEIKFNIKEIDQLNIQDMAIRIRKSMPEVSEQGFLDFLEQIEKTINREQFERLRPFNPQSGSLVTNLSKLPTKKLNFGTGETDFIFPLTIGRNSTAILADKADYILRMVY
jgi:hypothetical protein